jgi:hypothetical protein
VQQLFEETIITPEHILGGQTSTSSIEEEHMTNLPLNELATRCKSLQIKMNAIDFPMNEL